MTPLSRHVRISIGAAAAAVLAGALAVVVPPAGAAGGHPAGVINTFAIGTNLPLVSYDVAASPAGRAYIGWITNAPGTTRTVHLCTLPVTATSCSGRTETITGLDESSKDLKVLVTRTDTVKLVWLHDTANSISGPQGALISVASAPDGHNLVMTSDTTSAPSFGQLLTAEIGPGGDIWTAAYPGVPVHRIQVRPGISQNYAIATAPYPVADAELAFAGQKAVLTATKYGSISTAVHYAVRPSGGAWGTFHAVPKTWTGDGTHALETTRHGLRLVTGVNSASYRAVLARWTGSSFAPRQLTADTCQVTTHDGYADPSGRLLDVSEECGASKLGVTNYPDAAHAAITRFLIGGTLTFTPQIASGTRGIATVVWSVLSSTGSRLRVAHVRLADPTVTVRHHATGGTVTVTGPRSCLPPVNVHVGWTHHPDANWSFLSGSLRLGNQAVVGSTLDGATLTPGKSYTLIATATFGRSGDHSQVRATLSFRTCGTN